MEEKIQKVYKRLQNESYSLFGYKNEDFIQEVILGYIEASNKVEFVNLKYIISNYMLEKVYYPFLGRDATSKLIRAKNNVKEGKATDEDIIVINRLDVFNFRTTSLKEDIKSEDNEYIDSEFMTILKNVLSEKEFDVLYSNVVVGETRQEIATRYNTFRQTIDRIYHKACDKVISVVKCDEYL